MKQITIGKISFQWHKSRMWGINHGKSWYSLELGRLRILWELKRQ